MKKINNKGFVLAETLIVTVFLMTIVGLVYSYYIPLVAEYEKREVYDDIDSKYAMYWIKLLVEDASYKLSNNTTKEGYLLNKGYVRFSCTDISENIKSNICAKLVKSLEVEGCNNSGENCSIFISKYRIGMLGTYASNSCLFKYGINSINASNSNGRDLYGIRNKDYFTEFKAYINSLPNYTTASLSNSKYRVTAVFRHTRDNNDYYSYATMEVNK